MANEKPAPKKKAKTDNRSQSERFKEFARDHGADDAEALDKAMGDIGDDRKDRSPQKPN